MDKSQIIAKVEKFISEQFIFNSGAKIGHNDSLLETGTIDSTGMLELVLFLEESFAVKVADEDLVPDNLDSISRIATFVEHKQAAR